MEEIRCFHWHPLQRWQHVSFVFGLFFSIVMNFQYIVHKAEEGVAITVFFNEDATQEQIDDIGAAAEEAGRGIKIVELCVCGRSMGDISEDSILANQVTLAEGFKNDNPLAGSDNYEVYMTDVAITGQKLVSLCGKP